MVVSVDNVKVKVPKLVVLVTVDKVKVPKLMVLVNRNLLQPSHNLYKTHKKRKNSQKRKRKSLRY